MDLAFEAMKRIVAGLPEPAIVLNRNLEVLTFNRKAEDLFAGLKAGAHISSAVRHPKVLDAAAQCAPSVPNQTVRFTDRIPVERHMAVTVSFVGVDDDWSGPAILLFIDDLTEQVRMDELRSDFIANASHEIKTPLASLLGFIETLQGSARNDPAARERFLDIMAQQGERMSRLIDNLMSLSRIEMRAHLKPQDPVKIAQLVLRSVDALEPMARSAHIAIDVKTDIDGPTILGDEDELAQVFINLLHNALKYGRPGGQVRISVDRLSAEGSPKIAVTVEDDGPGIGKQHLPRLTERFYRAPEQGAMEKGGTGLGLAIVKHVVNRHRGEFLVTSEEGVGSKFTVVFHEFEQNSVT